MSLEGEDGELEGNLGDPGDPDNDLGAPLEQEELSVEQRMMQRLDRCDPKFLEEIAKLDKIIVKHTAHVKQTSNSLSKQYIAKKKREEEVEGIYLFPSKYRERELKNCNINGFFIMYFYQLS